MLSRIFRWKKCNQVLPSCDPETPSAPTAVMLGITPPGPSVTRVGTGWVINFECADAELASVEAQNQALVAETADLASRLANAEKQNQEFVSEKAGLMRRLNSTPAFEKGGECSATCSVNERGFSSADLRKRWWISRETLIRQRQYLADRMRSADSEISKLEREISSREWSLSSEERRR